MKKQIAFMVTLTLFVLACGAPTIALPTLDMAAIQTNAVAETRAADLSTKAPTNTPIPTDTPAPTDTPLPTSSPTPLPQPIVLTGTGDDVVDLAKWNGPAILKASHNGGGNFILWNVDGNGEHIELLVNQIGPYQGTHPLDFLDSERTTRFEINADGAWELQVLPFLSMEVITAPGTYQGTGSNVLGITTESGDPDLLKVDASQSDANIIIFSYSNIRDMVVNEIAPYTGTVALNPGTVAISIIATGPWSIEITTR